MNLERFDVAIVGAGPAGSAAAIMLARKGYSVALLDRRRFPREKLCGDFLSPINWPLFEELGAAQEILSLDHQKVGAFRISSFSGAEAALDFPRATGGRRFGLGLSRFYLDDLLVKRARGEGASIKEGLELGALDKDEKEWSLALGRPSAQARLHARLLIGADGRNSRVAHRLGLVRPAPSRAGAVAFQLRLRGVRGLGEEVQIHLFPGGYGGLVGLGGGTANLCLSVEAEVKGLSAGAIMEDYLCKNPYLRESLREAEIIGDLRSVYPVYFSPRRCYGDSFLLAGDAACVTEPVTGEGIYWALRSGELAAEAIHFAFTKGDFSTHQLSSYERACQAAFSRRRRVNGLIRALIHRPSLFSRLIRLSSKTSFPMRQLIGRVCAAGDP